MKTYYKIILVVILTLFIKMLSAQNINWAADKKSNRSLIHIATGLEHGVIYEAGYSYKISNHKMFPGYATVTYSFPSGNEIFDDFKSKAGANFNVLKVGSFQINAKAAGIFRTYKNDYVKIMNFGTEVSAVFGFFHKHGFVAVEGGFDKAIVTNLKHKSLYKEMYPSVTDGWYEPPAGGIFNFGLQGGVSLRNSDFTLRAGKTFYQDFHASPDLPFYAMIGYNYKF